MTQTVPDISPLMPMHQDPLLVFIMEIKTSGKTAFILRRGVWCPIGTRPSATSSITMLTRLWIQWCTDLVNLCSRNVTRFSTPVYLCNWRVYLSTADDVVCYRGRGITHWGRVTHICVGNTTIIGSDNGLSPGRRQAINWTNPEYCQLDPYEQTSVKIWSKFIYLHSRKCIWKYRLENGGHFSRPQCYNSVPGVRLFHSLIAQTRRQSNFLR